MSKHARTTITVPADLKARMDQVKQPVNWSALACRAFEHKLAELITEKGTRNMSDVILRLRASKQRLDSELYKEGKGNGEAWAKDEAEAEELQALADARYEAQDDWRDYLVRGGELYGGATPAQNASCSQSGRKLMAIAVKRKTFGTAR